jgi:hypothetical protein
MLLYADSEEYEQVSITVDGVHASEMNTSEPFEENEDPQFAMSVSSLRFTIQTKSVPFFHTTCSLNTMLLFALTKPPQYPKGLKTF